MSHTSKYTALVNRGRKAGLSTAEIYGALACRPPEGTDLGSGHTDGNGYVATYDQQGHCVYQQVTTSRG